MADGYDDSQIERMREQVRMSMGAMCDALSVTSVMSHGDPVAGTLDLNLESSVAMAVLGTSGSIDSNMMVTLLDGASPDNYGLGDTCHSTRRRHRRDGAGA